MATLILNANGNVTAAVFGTVDATSLLDSEANNTVLTTSYVESSTFTPGAITIDAIAVKIATRAASPSGTMSVRLAQAGVTVGSTEVTINVSDIQGSALLQNGWILFKFPNTLLVAATLYTVSAKTSVAAMVNLYRNATAANWSRMLRTTTGATAAAGDNAFVLGEFTAAGTFTARTLTWNQTVATDYGGAVTTQAGWGCGVGGTITWEGTAATNYIFQLSAVFDLWVGGTINMGSVVTPCPRDTTMIWQFDCAADGDFGLRVWGSLNMQGQSRIVGVTNHYVLLNADAAIAAVALTTDSQLSAKNTDEIAIATTTRTVTESEVRTMNGDAAATTVNITAGLTNAHKGSAPVFAEIISITRAVKIISTSSSFMSYVQLNTGCSVDCDWAEFKFVGSAAAGNKKGVEWIGTSGGVNLNKCVFRDSDGHGFYADNASGVGAFTLTDCVAWKWGVTGAANAVYVNEATTSAWTCTGFVGVGNSANGTGIYLNDMGGTLQNCRIAGCTVGFRLTEETSSYPNRWDGTFSGLTVHSCQSANVSIEGVAGGLISNLTSYRSGGPCLQFTGEISDLVIDTAALFGGTTTNINLSSISYFSNVTFRSVTSNGDTSFATTNGFTITGTKAFTGIRLEGCNFSTAATGKVAHTIDILLAASTAPTYLELYLLNTTLAAATEINNTSTLVGRSFIAYERHEGVTGQNRRFYPALGTVSFDSTTFRTATPSEQAAPTGATVGCKLRTNMRTVPVPSGQSCTITCYVNKSAGYNGNPIRLRVEANPAANVSEATVATHVGAAGSFSALSGTVGPVAEDSVLRFYTDGDGTAGQWNADDWAYSNA